MHWSGTTLTTIVIALASIGGVVTFKGDESLSSVLYATCLALFTSSIFYAVTVIAPETKRRNRIRRTLSRQYRAFKKQCIDLFLIASNSDYQYRENLLDHQEFRRYFSIRTANGQSRWDLVTTSIDNQDYIFDEIVREFDFLDREIEFARSSIEISDENAEQFFIDLRQVIHTIKAAEANSDDYKHFCRTLWNIFTRWNIIDVESMIRDI